MYFTFSLIGGVDGKGWRTGVIYQYRCEAWGAKVSMLVQWRSEDASEEFEQVTEEIDWVETEAGQVPPG